MNNFEFSYDFYIPGASTGAGGLVQGGSGSVFFWTRLRLQGAKIMRLQLQLTLFLLIPSNHHEQRIYFVIVYTK